MCDEPSPLLQRQADFLIMDNGSSHRGQACIQRLQAAWPTLVPQHLPIQASWLNQNGQLIVASTLSTQPLLNAEELGTTVLLVPPLHEQTAKG